MVSRRTNARLELVVSILLLLVQLRIWQYLWKHDEQWHQSRPVSVYGLVIGAFRQGAQSWLTDNDFGRIRSNRRRRFVASFCFVVWERLVCRRVSNPRAVRHSFGVGRIVGAICYRFWYGLLRPLPGDGR